MRGLFEKVMSTISVRPSGSLLIGVALLKKLGCTVTINFTKEVVEIAN